MTTRREKSKPQKPQLNNQLETAQTEQKPVGTEDHSIAFEAGKFCLDIAKLVFGGVILAGIMQQGIEFNSLFLTGLGVVLLFVAFGFYLIKKSNKKIGGNNYDADIIFHGRGPYWSRSLHRHYHLFSSSGRYAERKLTMGAYLVLAVIGVPCALFLLYCLTLKGKHWLRVNGML